MNMNETDSEAKNKDDVYYERDLLALAFIRAYRRTDAGEESAYGYWFDTDDVNGEDWAVAWIDLDGYGQVGWHIKRDDVPEWLPENDPEYDGYTTDEKNERLWEYMMSYASGVDVARKGGDYTVTDE